MPLKSPMPLKLPPGFFANDTAYSSKGMWVDGHMVRWHQRVLSPIGGWRKLIREPIPGRICELMPMIDNQGLRRVAAGTAAGLYLMESGGALNITPDGYAPGRNISELGDGFGVGYYGADEYGTPRGGATLQLPATSWAFDQWGQNLVAMADHEGVAYVWRPAEPDKPQPDTQAAAIPNAPTGRSLLTTQEFHLMIVGTGDGRSIAWSDRMDYSTWTATQENLAGTLTLQTDGDLLRAVQVGSSIVLLSDTDAFRIDYVGAQLVYGSQKIGQGCGLMAPGAVVSANDFAVWMGRDGFYLYNGGVVALDCSVRDWVFRDLNRKQKSLIQAGSNSEYGEVWWFFPSGENQETNNRYVVWNYNENVWYFGYLSRDCWSDKGSWDSPIAAKDGIIYEHEMRLNGQTYTRDSRTKPWIQSAPFDLQEGSRFLAVMSIVPDRDSSALDALEYTFIGASSPRTETTTYGPFRPDGDGFTDARFTGRQVAWQVNTVNDVDWRLGTVRLDVRSGAGR